MIGEAEKIERWHYERFAARDLSVSTISTLIAWRIEPRAVEALLDRGCPEELVLRILQPDDDPVVMPPLAETLAGYSIKV